MKTIQKITSVFLVAVLLLSGMGLSINKMVCLKSGKVKISLMHVKNCCPEKKSTQTSLKASCCDLKNTSFDQNEFNTPQKSDAPVVNKIVLSSRLDELSPAIICNATHSSYFNDLPPPLYGRQLLSFISILII